MSVDDTPVSENGFLDKHVFILRAPGGITTDPRGLLFIIDNTGKLL